MKKDIFDEELKIALKQYVEQTTPTSIETVKFSKKHNKKMEQLFKEFENNTPEINSDDNVKSVRRYIKVAIFVVLFLLVTIIVTPCISAWKKENIGLYQGKSEEYSWVLQNDITDVLENNAVNMSVDELNFLGYLPENCEVIEKFLSKNAYYTKLLVGNKTFSVKISKDVNKAIDSENVEYENILISNYDVYYSCKSGVHTFMWKTDDSLYTVYGYLEKEEFIKIIENINYEKIKNFL